MRQVTSCGRVATSNAASLSSAKSLTFFTTQVPASVGTVVGSWPPQETGPGRRCLVVCDSIAAARVTVWSGIDLSQCCASPVVRRQ